MTSRTSDTISPGDTLHGLRKAFRRERMWAFSGGRFALDGWPSRNVHTDPEAAERVGLKTLAASATQLQGHLCEMFIATFGVEWLRTGSMDVRFIAVVPDDEVLEYGARCTDSVEDSDGVQLTFDVWARNQAGDEVLVGQATARG
jgi:acyl dehydratase